MTVAQQETNDALPIGAFGHHPLKAVIYAGHMPDGDPLTGSSRFPAHTQHQVTDAARKAMNRYAQAGAERAFGSLAAGADIILAEAALEAGLRVEAVVPAGLDLFLDASVRDHDGGPGRKAAWTWEHRLHKILDNKAVTLHTLPADSDLPSHAFAAVNDHVLQLATGRTGGLGKEKLDPQQGASSSDIQPKLVQALLVLAETGVPKGLEPLGGTAHFARQLLEAQIAIDIINPNELSRLKVSGGEIDEDAILNGTQPMAEIVAPSAPDLGSLLPEFSRLDKDAVISQRAWRKKLHRMLLLFAVLMIVTGMEHMPGEAFGGNGKTLRLIAICATILGLGVEAGLGLKPNRMHRAWVRSRSKAEMLRAAAWSRMMGFTPLAIDEAAESHLNSPGIDAIAKQLAALPIADRWKWYSTHRLRDQATYYDYRSHKLHSLERRLLVVRYGLILLAMIWGSLRFVSELWHGEFLDPHIFHEYHFLGVAIALVSLLHVWLESTQAERLAGRYKALSRTLNALAQKVENAKTEAEAQHAAREGEELLFAQNEEWIGVVG